MFTHYQNCNLILCQFSLPIKSFFQNKRSNHSMSNFSLLNQDLFLPMGNKGQETRKSVLQKPFHWLLRWFLLDSLCKVTWEPFPNNSWEYLIPQKSHVLPCHQLLVPQDNIIISGGRQRSRHKENHFMAGGNLPYAKTVGVLLVLSVGSQLKVAVVCPPFFHHYCFCCYSDIFNIFFLCFQFCSQS